MNIKKIEEIDSSQMYKIYDKWPEIARESLERIKITKNFESVEHLVVCGMGGSGAIGDIISSVLSKEKIHVSVINGYTLPMNVSKDTLLVAISISGETEETLSALKQGYEKGCNIVAFASGGRLEKFCNGKKIDFYKLDMIHSPRASFMSFLFPIVKVLQDILKIKGEEVDDTLKILDETRENIGSSNLTDSNKALELAKWLEPTPVIYYPYGLKAVAIRFKNSLQENAKMHVINEDLIEACHNGIVSWETRSNNKPIFIRGTDDHPQTKKRWEILKDYFNEQEIPCTEIMSEGKTIFSKLINLVYILDYTSIYKAILLEIDPTPVRSIDFIKKHYDFCDI